MSRQNCSEVAAKSLFRDALKLCSQNGIVHWLVGLLQRKLNLIKHPFPSPSPTPTTIRHDTSSSFGKQLTSDLLPTAAANLTSIFARCTETEQGRCKSFLRKSLHKSKHNQDTQLRCIHEQEGGNIEQGLPILYGRDNGCSGSSWRKIDRSR